MTLKSRLMKLQEQAGRNPVTQSVSITTASSLRNRLANLRPERVQGNQVGLRRRMSDDELCERLSGEKISEGLIRIEETLPLTTVIGNTTLTVLSTTPRLPGEAHAKPGLYLDTETTGLAGGSGTLAFLVGIAVIKEDSIRLVQYLITNFAAEGAMLREVESRLAQEHRLVSYNGKTYDVPLLLTRFRMQGLKSSVAKFDHLDLLHPVRRLFARRWMNCRLTTVEKQLLNFYRADDLPGSEAPEAWFAFMRYGRGEQLIKVVEHNRQDILSLPAIHHTLVQAVERPAAYQVDMVGYARWLADIDESLALRSLEEHSGHLCDDGQRLYAHLLRRARHWPEAVAIWERLAEYGCAESIERLAKYHEHISKDLTAAMCYCKQLPTSQQGNYRQSRLRRKMGVNFGGETP